jgi:hypothetical protein
VCVRDTTEGILPGLLKPCRTHSATTLLCRCRAGGVPIGRDVLRQIMPGCATGSPERFPLPACHLFWIRGRPGGPDNDLNARYPEVSVLPLPPFSSRSVAQSVDLCASSLEHIYVIGTFETTFNDPSLQLCKNLLAMQTRQITCAIRILPLCLLCKK